MQFIVTTTTQSLYSQACPHRDLLRRRSLRRFAPLRAVALAAAVSGLAIAQSAPDFDKDIKPVLAEKCYACHSGNNALGGIRLDARHGAIGQGDSGQLTIVPGDSAASELIRRVTSTEKSVRMPLVGDPLAAEQIATLRAWIDAGASWPESAGAEAVPAGPTERVITDRDRQHWAYRPLSKDDPPAARTSGWARTPVDAFILTRLEEKGLTPSSEADRRTLVRRLYYDLLGLPPTPEEIEAFVNDSSPHAYDTLVDRLLANPHYGERWGRHWLDVARYADSEGYENDYDRLTMYRYRDFVIRALNEDMPFDQFVRWQIAGDEYEPDNPRAVIATGFLAAGPRARIAPTDSAENKERYLYDELDDLVRTTSDAMLGLTVGCARCHDHKFDAIPTRDYYRMVATFRSFDRGDAPLSSAHRRLNHWLEEERAELREQKMEEHQVPEEDRILLRVPLNRNNSGQKAVYREYDKKLQYTEQEFRAWLGADRRATLERLERAVADAEAWLNGKPEQAYVVVENQAEPTPSHLLGRGSVVNKVEEVPSGFLTVLNRGKSPEEYRKLVYKPGRQTTFQRSALAEWLVDAEHGAGNLVARVAVNRLWQHHFGTGLVGTPNDFGLQGDRPTHPALLDWLASELIRGGWKLKPIHRLILQSAVYRQSTEFDAKKAEVDPDNHLMWRRRPVRIEAEILRDAMLQSSGWLDSKMYGPAVRPFIPSQAISTRTKDKWPDDIAEGPDTWRRSVYLFVKRSVRLPMMETFDSPDTNLSCGRRVPTTVPTQSLALMNDGFVREQARRLARRIESEAPDRDSRIALGYRLVLGRNPTASERTLAESFLDTSHSAQQQRLDLVDFCHALFTLNEFFYID